MQPKAIPTRLIAADHRYLLTEPKAFPGQVDLIPECSQVASGNSTQARALPKPDREAQHPFALAQFKCHVKVRLTYSILICVGRFCKHKLLLSVCYLKLSRNDPFFLLIVSNGVRYRQVRELAGWTRPRRFDGTSFEPRKLP